MAKVAPLGPVYQAGTLSGNPLAVTAGIAMLRYLDAHPETYDILERNGALLAANPPAGVCVNRVGSMLTFFFQEGPVRNYEDSKKSDIPRFGRFFHALLSKGIYFPPSQYEALFISAVHTPDELTATAHAVAEAFDAA
jgi:glutamate-1-semialdehyde 2,1-aminomutase